jgi:hypothetical protein
MKLLFFPSGLVCSGFARRSRIRRFFVSEKSDDFVGVPFAGQHYLVWPSLRTGTAARVNVDNSVRGRMAGALAIFAKRHFIAPDRS